MATSVDELVNILFEMIDEAKGVLMSPDKCTIERDKALDLLDDIRAQLPVELAEAKKLLDTRSEYIAAAKREADNIKKQAEEQARQMVAGDKLLSQAKERSNEVIQSAEDRARKLKKAANDYCEDVLRRTEEAVSDAYKEIQSSHAHFRSASSSGGSADSAPVQSAGASGSGTGSGSGNRAIFDAEAEK